MLMAGDVSTHIANNRREAVLKKVKPLLNSLANEEFVGTKRQLFGPGFEQHLKARSETAETLGKALENPFFEGRPPVDFQEHAEADNGLHSKHFVLPNAELLCSIEEVQPGPEISEPPNVPIRSSIVLGRPGNLPKGMFSDFLPRSSSQTETPPNRASEIFRFNMRKNYRGSLGFTSSPGLSNRICKAFCANFSGKITSSDSSCGDSTRSGSERTAGEAGSASSGSQTSDRRLYKFDVCSPKKGRGKSPCSEPETLESVSSIRAFQNGGHPHVTRPLTTRGRFW